MLNPADLEMAYALEAMTNDVNQVVKPVHDVRTDYPELHEPDPARYGAPQVFAKALRDEGSWGLLYSSVRLVGHECVAAFRPPAVSLPVQGKHVRYVWDGKSQTISHVFEISLL